MRVWSICILILWIGISTSSFAQDFLPTVRECHEGSDFIEHAAMSRDNGYSKKKIVGLFDDNVTVLSGMDPEKRWFVRSPGATRFLREALLRVFDIPRKPKDAATVFLRSCLNHTQVISPDDL